MPPLEPTLQTRLEAFIDFKVKHPRLEARTGERKVELAKAQSEHELQRLLGNPMALPGITVTSASRNGVESEPEQSASTRSKTRIAGAASRDLVGDQVKTANVLKCSFPGVVEIEPKRFLDSGIKLVEWPDCVSMRSLELRNGVLRFPSHDKRKTRTPNTDRRWALGKTAWEVVGGERK